VQFFPVDPPVPLTRTRIGDYRRTVELADGFLERMRARSAV
jgi:hypothetical protein